MGGDGLRVVLEVHVVQSVDEQGWVVVQSCDGHLQTHGPQLAGLHPAHQTLQNCLHKQRDALQVGNKNKSGCYSLTFGGSNHSENLYSEILVFVSYKQLVSNSHTDLQLSLLSFVALFSFLCFINLMSEYYSNKPHCHSNQVV